MPHLRFDYGRILPGGPESRFRERVLVVGVALLVSALFCAITSVYVVTVVQDNVLHSARDDARRNCEATAAGRVSGNRFRFAIREELAFIPNIISASAKTGQETKQGKQFVASEIMRLNRDLTAERRKTSGLPRHVKSFDDLFSLLQDSPLISCTGGSAQ